MPDTRLGGTSTEIIDNLESTSILAALSANQGRVLNGKIQALDERVQDLESGSGSGTGSDITITLATASDIVALFN